MKSFFKRNVADPVRALLWEGITPERIARSLAVGFAVGCAPVLGSGTILCTLAAVAFRLNLPAIQAANWLSYPVQLALLIPFFRAGEFLFGADPISLSPAELVAMFRADFWGSIAALGSTTWHAVVVWAFVAGAFIPLATAALVPALRRIPRTRHA